MFFFGPMTQYCFIDLMSQGNFFGPMNQHHLNKTGPMSQIPDNSEAFLYQSQYCLVTLQHALLQSFSHCENPHIQFTGRREIPILDHSQIEFIFYSISSESADTSYFLHGIRKSSVFAQTQKKANIL
jgi:hypothetical protein